MVIWISIKKWSIIGVEYGLKEFNLLCMSLHGIRYYGG